MSYCVNCGVELHPTASRCALCATSVVNPAQPIDESAPPPYPSAVQPPPATNRPFIARLLAWLLLLPIAVCAATNLVFPSGYLWAVYPIGAIVLFWVLVAVPLLLPHPLPLVAIGIDAIAVLAYLFLIAAFDNKGFAAGLHWYLNLALPIVCILAAAVLVPVAVLRTYRFSGIHTAALLFTITGLAILGVETTVSFFVGTPLHLSWSWIVLVSCLAMTAALLIIERSPHLLEEIRRRLHM
jgi:hypothetical protein